MQIPFSCAYFIDSPSQAGQESRRAIHEMARRLNLRNGRYRRSIPCYFRSGTDIIFNFPETFSATSSKLENDRTLYYLLDCMVKLNRVYLRNAAAPKLYECGVRYGRTVEWEPLPELLKRGYGDCKSVATIRVAEYLEEGIEAFPVFRWDPRKDGSEVLDFHILVQVGDDFEDPSKVLGMGANENAPLLRY